MATIVISLQSVCDGGGHVTLGATLNGANAGQYSYDMDDLIDPITDDDRRMFIKLAARLHKIGKTKAQVKTDLTIGLTVVI